MAQGSGTRVLTAIDATARGGEATAHSGDEPARSNPYVGPLSLQDGQGLFGRDKELRQLRDMVLADRVVLVYAPSGAGKSSLLEAGLRSAMSEYGFVIPKTLRVGHLAGPTTVNRYLASATSDLSVTGDADGTGARGVFAAQVAATSEQAGEHDVCLLIDQFEEVFTLDPTDASDKRAFFEELGVVLRDQPVWAVLAMREDFIARLDPYLELLPRRLSARFRLDFLAPEAAAQAIGLPAASAGRPFASDAVEALVTDLRRTRVAVDGAVEEREGPHVEPVQLQVVCRRLWERLPPERAEITLADVAQGGSTDHALEDFYARQVAQVSARTRIDERTIREWIESELITRDGFRSQASEFPHDDGIKLLNELESAYVLRGDTRRGVRWYELTHDRLVRPVRIDNERWRATQLTPTQAAAREWDSRKRPERMLLRGSSLSAAETWAQSDDARLNAVDRDFLVQSQKARAQLRVRGVAAVLATLLVIACGAGLFIVHADNEANRKRRSSEAGRIANRIELAQQRSFGEAVAISVIALAISPDPDVRSRARGLLLDARDVVGVAREDVNDIDVTDDGKVVVSASGDGTIRSWSLSRKELLHVHTTRRRSFTSVAVSPDGGYVAGGDYDGRVRLWKIGADGASNEAGSITSPYHDSVAAIAFVDALHFVTAGLDNGVHLWDVRSLDRPVQLAAGTAVAMSVAPGRGAFAVTGQLASAGSGTPVDEWAVWVWDATTPTAGPVLEVPLDAPMDAVALGPDAASVVTAGADGLRIYRARQPGCGRQACQKPEPIEIATRPTAVAVNSAGTLVAVGDDRGAVRLYDVDGAPAVGRAGAVRHVHGHSITAIRLLADRDGGRLRIVTSSADDTIRVTELSVGPPAQLLGDVVEPTYAVAASPDGRTVATLQRAALHLWDGATGKPLAPPIALAPISDDIDVPVGARALAFSPDGGRLAFSDRGALRIVSTGRGKEGRTFGHEVPIGEAIGGSQVLAVAFDRSGTTLAVTLGCDRAPAPDASARAKVALRRGGTGEAGTGRCDGSESNGSESNGSDGSDGSDVAVSADAVDAIALVDVATGRVLADGRHTSQRRKQLVAFGAPGVLAAAGDDGVVVAWGAKDADGVRRPRELGMLTNVIESIAFDDNGRRLLVAGDDETIRLLDPVRAVQVGEPLEGHAGAVLSAIFTPLPELLASTSDDGTLRVWDATSQLQLGKPLLQLEGTVRGVAALKVAVGESLIRSDDGVRLVAVGEAGVSVVDVPAAMGVEKSREELCALLRGIHGGSAPNAEALQKVLRSDLSADLARYAPHDRKTKVCA